MSHVNCTTNYDAKSTFVIRTTVRVTRNGTQIYICMHEDNISQLVNGNISNEQNEIVPVCFGLNGLKRPILDAFHALAADPENCKFHSSHNSENKTNNIVI